MTTPGPFDLYGRAAKLLDLVTAGLSERVESLPDRRYVAQGSQVAYDTEQLTVSPTAVAPGQAGRPEIVQDYHAVAQSARFIVCIVRAVPLSRDDGEPPSVAELNAAASVSAGDVAALYDTLVAIREDAAFVDRAVPFGITDVHQEGPLGGVVATVGTIDVGLF